MDCPITRTQLRNWAMEGQGSGSHPGSSGRGSEDVAWETRRTTPSLESREGLDPGQSCFVLYLPWQVLQYHFREFKNKQLTSTHSQVFEEVTNRLPSNFNYTSFVSLSGCFHPVENTVKVEVSPSLAAFIFKLIHYFERERQTDRYTERQREQACT